MHDALGRTAGECLRIGVGADELDALHAALHHVFDGVAAAAPHADDLDLCALIELFNFDHFDAHECLLQDGILNVENGINT